MILSEWCTSADDPMARARLVERRLDAFVSELFVVDESLVSADAETEDFMCPITHQRMTDPVVAGDGRTYERSAIERWFAGHDTSPMTGSTLPSKDLFPK